MKSIPSLIEIRKRVAFTLIELLVVIAIIAILASLLLPVLSRAKDKGYGAIDLNNNRQVMIAMTMYTQDHEDYMPAPGWGTGRASWLYGAGFPRGGNGATDQMVARQLESVKKGQLWPYLETEKVYICPLDFKEQKGSKKRLFNQRVVYLSSYVWNGSIISYGRLANANTHKLSSFKSHYILQWEGDELNPFFFNDVSSRPDRGISQRHGTIAAKDFRRNAGGGAHVGTFGGSARYITYTEYYALAGAPMTSGAALSDSALPNALWNDPQDPRRGGAGR